MCIIVFLIKIKFYLPDTKIKYLDGKELVTLSIDSYREFYDAENQPYIEIKESKNTYGDVLETNVIIHLKELENE